MRVGYGRFGAHCPRSSYDEDEPETCQCIGVVLHCVLRPATSASRRRSTEKQIRKLDLAHAEAIFKGEINTLQKLLPDDHTVNHPTNRIVQEKAERLKLIGEGVVHYTRFERRPEKFLFYKDLVVVMGDETVVPGTGAPNEGKVLRRRYTNAWMRQDGKWRLAFRHANNVPESSTK